ncbi:MAG: ABC transporter ATP-binding protein/permease, partial [Gammaproteobacteria bacterium]|nr:ABC transporter ATP-binding protein/permease [Gammaproteobacteria bacterium]
RHAMEGLKELRVLGVEKNFNQSMASHADEYTKIQARFNTIFNMPRYLAEFSVIFFIVSLVSIAELTIGRTDNVSILVGIFGFAALRLMPAANSLMAFFTQARFQRATVQHLARDYRDLSPESKNDYKLNPAMSEPFVELKAKNLRFSYPSAKDDAINDVSLKLKKGEAIAFIGPSGSGKTTLVDILLGLLEPQSGSVEVNGHPLSDNHRRLLDHVAYLPQHVFLIDDTLRANIAIGMDEEEVDDNLIHRAVCQAQLEDLVKRLPNGIDTVIGDHGLRLSGGQRQRVALARAFYHHKDVIIMDEATSALDSETEREIVNEINLLKGKTTLIVIAHRLTTIQECDHIYRLEGGRITHEGTFDEVTKRTNP